MLYDVNIANYSINKTDYSTDYSAAYSNANFKRKVTVTRYSQILVLSTTNLAANFILGRSKLDRLNYEGYADTQVFLDNYMFSSVSISTMNNSKVFYIGNVAPGTYTLTINTDDNTNFISVICLDNMLTLTNIRANIATSPVDFTTRVSLKARLDNNNSEIKLFKTFSTPRPSGS